MAACHESQFFDWLAYHDGVLAEVPEGKARRHAWLASRFTKLHQDRCDFFASDLEGLLPVDSKPSNDSDTTKIELFEVSEYAGRLTDELREQLFPGNLISS